MEFDTNDIKISMNETTQNVESQNNIQNVISDFHNYDSHEAKNASKITLLNNTSVPNTDLPSNGNNLCNSIIFKVGKYYLCPKCKRTFTYLKNLKRHVKNMHPCLMSSLFPSGKHKCDICEKSFKSLRSLQNHYRIRHKSHTCQKPSECPEKCKFQKQHKCPLCPETLRITKLGEHFEKSHNLLLKPIKLNFGSYEKFCEWKKAIERVTKSYFVKQSSRETNGITRHTFICHRSGTFIRRSNNNKRKLKAQGSRKMNAYCPAVMKVIVVKEGKCEIEFQSQHLGHENETKHLNLTYEERLYIAEKLATNLSLSDILIDIKNSASKDRAERLCLLTRKDLHNIKSSVLKDRQSYLCTAKLDEKLLKDLRDIHDKHAESEHIKADITKIEKGWLLTFVEHNEVYLIKENSKLCDCPLVCVYCKVCVRSYVCNCSDSYVEGNMCKHIHFLCMERNKMFDTPDSNDHFDCDDDMAEIPSNSEQCDSLHSSSNILAPSKVSKKCKDNNFADFEKRCALKNKFSFLIDSLTTEEEFKLFENAIADLTVKLKSVHIHPQDKNVISATTDTVGTVHINENTQDQHNLILATNHPLQAASVNNNRQDQHNSILATNDLQTVSINNRQDQHNSNSQKTACFFNAVTPATNHSTESAHIHKNTQNQHNSTLATNHILNTVKVIDNKQGQQNSNSEKIIHRPLVLKMLKPVEGARICYIHFAKVNNKQ